MIEQILNKRFMLEQMAAVRNTLGNSLELEGTRRSTGVALPSKEEQVAARTLLKAAEAKLAVEQVAVPLAEEGTRRGGATTVTTIDDRAFIPRDPVMSTMQSALEEYFETHEPAAIESLLQGRRSSKTSAVTDRRLKNVTPIAAPPPGRRLFNKFSILDARWVACKVAEGITKWRGPHRFNTTPATPVTIRNDARLLLVGDWGSGLARARKVAREMRRVLEEGKSSGREQHVIHLGDVYYSGWKREYERHFLKPWPVLATETEIGSWCLNGNHDMYSGGHAFFDYLLAEPRFARQERSSFFSLRNEGWQVLGLDTAYTDDDLDQTQADWVSAQVAASNRKLILLSHHQLFSAYEKSGDKLKQRLSGPLESGRIRAWFWGHEHRCMLYDSYMGVQAARCLGHGGVPVYQWHQADAPYPPPGSYEFRGKLSGHLEPWALFGFAVLDFHDEQIEVRYINELGQEHHQEILV